MATSSVMGVITQVLQAETGTAKSGNQWVRQTIIIKKITNSPYESFVALDLNSLKRIQEVQPQVGMIGEFFFDADSREANGKWFTSLSCYKVKPFQMVTEAQQPQQAQATQPMQAPQQPMQQMQGMYQQPAQAPQPQNGGLPF